jgi:hypothetical protein
MSSMPRRTVVALTAILAVWTALALSLTVSNAPVE